MVEQLQKTGRNGSWAVFMFRTDISSPDTDDPFRNLQYAVEDDVVGLQWVLFSSRNLADVEDLIDLIVGNGY